MDMDSSLDIHSLAYIDFVVPLLPLAEVGFGIEIANPSVETAALNRAPFVGWVRAESFGRRAGIVVDSTDFPVCKDTNHNFVVVFEKDKVDWLELVDDSFDNLMVPRASFAPSIHN